MQTGFVENTHPQKVKVNKTKKNLQNIKKKKIKRRKICKNCEVFLEERGQSEEMN